MSNESDHTEVNNERTNIEKISTLEHKRNPILHLPRFSNVKHAGFDGKSVRDVKPGFSFSSILNSKKLEGQIREKTS
jgi:hypothetical protein